MSVPSAVATMLAMSAICSDRTIELLIPGTASQWSQLSQVNSFQV